MDLFVGVIEGRALGVGDAVEVVEDQGYAADFRDGGGKGWGWVRCGV